MEYNGVSQVSAGGLSAKRGEICRDGVRNGVPRKDMVRYLAAS